MTRSTPVRRSGLRGEQNASAGCTITGRRLAYTPSSARSARRPVSGLLWRGSWSSLGSPTAPSSTASASRTAARDRKSTRLNSSHGYSSYAVFCLKKKSSLMAVNIHITIIELNSLHTKRQNLFQELDAVIHLLMEAKHWGLRKSRNATSLNSRFKSLNTLKVKIISVTFRRVIRTNHKKASKIWIHYNILLRRRQSRLLPYTPLFR